MDTTDDAYYYCTKRFDANPDVSGIGVSTQLKWVESGLQLIIRCFQILIAFYGQAILVNALLSANEWFHYFSSHKTHLHKRIKAIQDGLITDWVTAGFAMIIAALSQWRTISMFHLYLCSNLVIIIPIPNYFWINFAKMRRTRLQIIYFGTFEMLRFAMLSYLLYRFVRFWSNTSGQCFIPIPGGTGSPGEMVTLSLGMVIPTASEIHLIIATLVYINKGMSRRSQKETGTAVEVQATTIDDQKLLAFWTKRKKHILIFIVRFVVRGLAFTCSVYWVMAVVHANRMHIVGDEYIFSFGQVSALVALAASFYKIGNSFLGKPCVPS